LIPMGSAHYKIILTYNGSAFAGFQRQNDDRTVQGEIENGLRKIGWQGQSILGAGRTDAGVHARAQVVSFELDWVHTTEDLRNALNYYLPRDMAVQTVEEAVPDFHPRFDARSRRYSYHIFCQPVRDPLRGAFAWRVWPEVDLALMNKAAQALIGNHDFSGFGSPTSEGGSTIREVYSAEWVQDGDEYCFEITANAFLYHMVRRITYALVKIGTREAPVNLVEDALKSGEISLQGLAPAEGLVLEEVIYL
jgi:tRNA pseudouridine38-40 synthase